MANGFAALEAHIARLHALGELTRRAAPAAADAVEGVLHRQIAAGVDPDGKAWAPRKDNGEQPLQHAADALAVVPLGTKVYCRLKGPEARHHRGTARGGIVRRILPVKGLPKPMERAITDAIVDVFNETMEAR